MNIKKLLVVFVTAFAVNLTVSAIVTLLWNFIVHGVSTVDWEASFRFATVFGIGRSAGPCRPRVFSCAGSRAPAVAAPRP